MMIDEDGKLRVDLMVLMMMVCFLRYLYPQRARSMHSIVGPSYLPTPSSNSLFSPGSLSSADLYFSLIWGVCCFRFEGCLLGNRCATCLVKSASPTSIQSWVTSWTPSRRFIL